MIYLNGQIGAVYMGGHYHSEVYLGSVLVWSGVKKIPYEAHAQLAFANTADGVAVVVLPGDASEALAMTANVMAEAHGTAGGSSGELLTLLTAAETTAAGTSNGATLENLLLQCTALGKDIIVNKLQIEELLKLTTSVPPAVALGLVPAGDVGDELTLTTPVPPAVAATLVDDKTSSALQLVQTASSGDTVLFADGQIDGGEVITATAEGAVADGADGAAAAEMVVGSAIQPETLTVADGQGTGQLAAETQTQPEVLTLAEALASAGLTLEHKAVGAAIGWLYPEKYGSLLVVKQVYSATVKQDGVLGNILEVT